MADPSRLLRDLERADTGSLEVVLLPGVSLDMLLRFPGSEEAFRALHRAREEGNGDVHPEEVLLRPGGGAANTAHALGRLGVRAHVLARTSPAGARFLQATLGPEGVDLSHLRTDGVLTATAALELGDSSIMITEQSGNPFGPDDLDDAGRDLIRRADAVVIHDWSNPRVYDLAAAVWPLAKEGGARTYTDTSDPPEDAAERARLLDTLSDAHLDAVSVNARELQAFTEDDWGGGQGGAPARDDLRSAGEVLSRDLGTRVDLHSLDLTASFQDGRMIGEAPRFHVEPRQATGAGDTWDAGNLLGDALGMDASERLLLANALVSLYVGAQDARPPNLTAVRELLERGELVAER